MGSFESDDTARPGTSPPARRRWVELAILVGLSLARNLAGNGRTSRWDRDEPLYVGCTRETVEAGTCIRPNLHGYPVYHKPVLSYWLMRTTTRVSGDNPYVARMVPALAGTGLCIVVWAWGRRLLGAGW